MNEIKFEQFVEPFCDHYCKYPALCRDAEQLEEKCEECPICKLAEELGY